MPNLSQQNSNRCEDEVDLPCEMGECDTLNCEKGGCKRQRCKKTLLLKSSSSSESSESKKSEKCKKKHHKSKSSSSSSSEKSEECKKRYHFSEKSSESSSSSDSHAPRTYLPTITNAMKWWLAIFLGFLYFIIAFSGTYYFTNAIWTSVGLPPYMCPGGPTAFGTFVHAVIFTLLIRLILW